MVKALVQGLHIFFIQMMQIQSKPLQTFLRKSPFCAWGPLYWRRMFICSRHWPRMNKILILKMHIICPTPSPLVRHIYGQTNSIPETAIHIRASWKCLNQSQSLHHSSQVHNIFSDDKYRKVKGKSTGCNEGKTEKVLSSGWNLPSMRCFRYYSELPSMLTIVKYLVPLSCILNIYDKKYLLLVIVEFKSLCLQEGCSNACNGIIVWSTLQARKYSLVDLTLQIIHDFLSCLIHTPHTCKHDTHSQQQKTSMHSSSLLHMFHIIQVHLSKTITNIYIKT